MVKIFTTLVYDAWFVKLRDLRARQRITLKLRSVELGNFGDSKSVGGGVSELRVAYGPGYRVYFCRRGLEIIILLCGGDKSSQRADIKAAQKLAAALKE